MNDQWTVALQDISEKNLEFVAGITNLNSSGLSTAAIQNSRGEFSGFFTEDSQLVLFRDRLGARNIYYAIHQSQLYISPDLAWVGESIGANANWDLICNDYMQFQLPFDDQTFFAGVHKVLPGELVRIDATGTAVSERYWDVEFNERAFKAEELADLIRDAVAFRLTLIGGEPFTAYLSGGLDSSAMTLLARPDECLSGFYEEEGYSEMNYIDAVLKEADRAMKHTPVQITQDSFQALLPHLAKILPDPCAGLGVIPQVIVAREAANRGYHYAFTGEGGDESFLGYNWNTMVLAMADAARGLLRDRYMVRYEPMVEKVLRDGLATFTGGLLARGDDVLYATQRVLELWDRSQPVENNISLINLKLGLPAILTLDEQVGRYSGVEPVSPLIDHRIVEYACSIRPSDRAPIPKHMMREALKGILPDKVRTRYEKMGFPVPYKSWDWPSIPSRLSSLAGRGKIAFDASTHHTMDRSTWALYSISAWCSQYLDHPET